MENEFSALARTVLSDYSDSCLTFANGTLDRDRLGDVAALMAKAVAEATSDHLMVEPETTPCDDPPDGDGTILGPKCLADIAQRAQERLKNVR